MTYSNIAISLTTDKGKSYIYGYIPVFVGKTGVFLKEKGQFVSNHRVHRSPLKPYTQQPMLKASLASVGPLVAFRQLRLPLIILRVTARDWTGVNIRFTTQHAS